MWNGHQIGVLVFAVLLVACGSSTVAQQPTVAESSACDGQHVASTDAGNHIGQEVTVCGEVTDYHYTNTGPAPTRLLFDEEAYTSPRRS